MMLLEQIVSDRDVIEELRYEAERSNLGIDESRFLPEINELDELLPRIIKSICYREVVCLASLKRRYGKGMVNNYVNTLLNRNRMGWRKFIRWLDMLGYTYRIEIYTIGIASSSTLKDGLYSLGTSEEDDLLIRIVKHIFRIHRPDIRLLRNRIGSSYFQYLRTLLLTKHSLSWEQFKVWMDILNVSYKLKVYKPKKREV